MSLRHRPAHEDEDASALRLGPEFNNAGCLLISEVRYLLEHRPSEKAAPDTSVYKKTLEYVKTFAKFDKPEAAAAIRDLVKVDDDKLQPLLDEIQTMRKFQS
ncbi:DNA-directed RNA polymerase II subunit rpb4 [Trametes pubescens]|uniref:DNA-directed RNA polymerase II subunit rpb4 n=1 Tax=Trametes pubescens TaxID=154538 RepID=A0A1M2VTG4_TRAPU|nr:DNA-directed RNA polymerase II subunit rpb4 [Trametes pubescens]